MALCPDYEGQLQQGSFRGISFTVTATSDGYGQRGPTHQFPHRQEPYSEFLGRKHRTYSIEGYINGEDHLRQMQRLVSACEIPSPGRLVHPAIGGVMVKVVTLKVDEDYESRQGETRFSMECHEAGSSGIGGGLANALGGIASFRPFGFGVFEAVTGLRDQLVDSFDAVFDLAQLPQNLVRESLAPIIDAAGFVSNEMQGLVNWTTEVSDVFSSVSSLRDAFSPVNPNFSGLSLAGVTTSFTTRPNSILPSLPVKSIGEIFVDASIAMGVDYKEGNKDMAIERLGAVARFRPSIEATSSTQLFQTRVNDNINAAIQTVRTSALAEQSRLIFEDDTHFKSYGESLRYLSEVEVLMGQEMEIARQRNDDSLHDAMYKFVEEVREQTFELAPVLPTRLIVNVCQNLPSVVASHRVYGSLTNLRDLEDGNPSASSWMMPSKLEIRREQEVNYN